MTQWGLDTLFNPAKRHMDEEKRRLQSTREEVGDNSGGKRVDLESGKVKISRANADDEGATESDTGDDVETAAGAATPVETSGTGVASKGSRSGPASKGSRGARDSKNSRGARDSKGSRSAEGGKGSRGAEASGSATGAPTAAQVRAAQRRGRTPR